MKIKNYILLGMLVLPITSFAELHKIGDDSYINTFLTKDIGNGVIRVNVLTSYDEITSAQMFGLSEEENIDINCNAQLVRYLDSQWFSGKMGKGKIVKRFPAIEIEWTPFYFNQTPPQVCLYLQRNGMI
jgi:hypothetical protein